jgi:hypothetical protein
MTEKLITVKLLVECRSQWLRCLRHELSSPAWTLGSWVRILLKTWMFVCMYSVFVLSCVQVAALGRAHPRPRSHTDSFRIKKLKWNEAFHDWLMFQSGSNRKERERESWWNENWQGKPKYLEKTCTSTTLSTTNPALLDLVSNSGLDLGEHRLIAWAMSWTVQLVIYYCYVRFWIRSVQC